ncbi:MAG: hypothetical protein ACRDY7_07905 [Acidimicrobiia bacterium]
MLRGQDAAGLVRYLFGPGKANEHTDPRVVAGWDSPTVLGPPVTARGLRDPRPLIGGLNLMLAAAEHPAKCVWHCSLRAAPGDRALSDAEWADVAAEVMDRTGLAARGDDGGCRWVAVRHAEDHVHLVVTLARQDGQRAALHNDFYRVGEATGRGPSMGEEHPVRRPGRRGPDGLPPTRTGLGRWIFGHRSTRASRLSQAAKSSSFEASRITIR